MFLKIFLDFGFFGIFMIKNLYQKKVPPVIPDIVAVEPVKIADAE